MNYGDGKENISEIFRSRNFCWELRYYYRPKRKPTLYPQKKMQLLEETYSKWKIDLVEANSEPEDIIDVFKRPSTNFLWETFG